MTHSPHHFNSLTNYGLPIDMYQRCLVIYLLENLQLVTSVYMSLRFPVKCVVLQAARP